MDETTPEAEYDGGTGLVTVVLTVGQAGAVVVALMELAKQSQTAQQMDLSRLALGINDLLVEAQNGGAESD